MTRKIILSLLLMAGTFFVTPQASADYDPQHTVSALNMAVVSIQRILSTNDRAVLEMEYRNIINNLKIGNIESDPELLSLYEELMNTISGKLLAREASDRIQKNYDEREKALITTAITRTLAGTTLFSKAITPKKTVIDPATMLAGFTISCVSSYFMYQEEAQYLRKQLDEKLYRIDVEERKSYNTLQTRLLNSSWRLMRQYHLPDEYRITQDDVSDLFRAVNENDGSKSLRMLQALEGEFRIYPPYWVYRARSAQRAGNSEEAAKCFDEFGKAWRPVLRNDPFRLEAAKYNVQEALRAGNNGEALRQLAVVRENTPRSDWADNLFAGVAYYVLGSKDKAVKCVELNINFEAEQEISGVVIAQMRAGKLDAETLPAELRKIIGIHKLGYETLVLLAENGDIESQLTLGNIYTDGGISFGLGKIYDDGEITSKDYAVALGLYSSTKMGGKNERNNVTVELSEDGGTAKFTFGKTERTLIRIVAADYAQAVTWYKRAAEQGSDEAILRVASLYAQGGPNMASDYGLSAEWFRKLADKDNEAAILALARLYERGGANLPEDYAEAVKWYRKAAYNGSKAGAEGLARLYFTGGANLERSYYDAYVWCCVADMTENFSRFVGASVGLVGGAVIGGGAAAVGAGLGLLGVAGASAGAFFLPVALPVAGVFYLLFEFGIDNSIKDDIEGKGLFTFAKLSSEEMGRAKLDAEIIMGEIERNVQTKLNDPAKSPTGKIPGTAKPRSPVISAPEKFDDAIVGEEYYFSGLALSGDEGPVVWSFMNLPKGIKAYVKGVNDLFCVLSGEPTKAGEFTVTVRARNRAKRRTVEARIPFTVLQKPTVTTKRLPNAKTDKKYSVKLTATGSTPIAWGINGLPDTLEISQNETGTTLMISGTPKTAGDYEITTMVSNAAGYSESTLNLVVR